MRKRAQSRGKDRHEIQDWVGEKMRRRAESHERDRHEIKDWVGEKMRRRAESHERDTKLETGYEEKGSKSRER